MRLHGMLTSLVEDLQLDQEKGGYKINVDFINKLVLY